MYLLLVSSLIFIPIPCMTELQGSEKDSCRILCEVALRYEDESTMRQFTCTFAKPIEDFHLKPEISFVHCGNHLDNSFHRERKEIQRKFLFDLFRHPTFKYTGPLGFITKDSGAIQCETALALYRAGFPFLSHSNRRYDGTNCSLFDPVIFQPDYYFIQLEGFKAIISELKLMNISFEEKHKKIVWRGSTTGKADKGCENLNRVKICEAARNISWLDFGISRNLPACRGRPLTNSIPETEWIRYRGILDIDGFSNAWGLFWRLSSGSVVFKVDSPYTNAYISKMRPWVHYIPISLDFNELANVTKIILSDDPTDVQLLKDIATNARVLVEPFTYLSEVDRVARELNTFSSRLRNPQ